MKTVFVFIIVALAVVLGVYQISNLLSLSYISNSQMTYKCVPNLKEMQ